ncbi:MAG TPA: DUF5996 family protein [Povalibacter sp.]|nr:DUF5996 family protein [Povalibacter sp.]
MSNDLWPELPFADWRETCQTLHLWTQVVGKVRLAKTPWLNHSWHVALYVTSSGLTTSPIPFDSRVFELRFDFNRHRLDVEVSDGSARQIALRPMTVADFHAAVMQALTELGIEVAINDLPCEIPGAIAFSGDRTHAAYDPRYVQRFWRVLLQADRIFKKFRTGFLGKSSPVHFFWGSFDLAVTRFSGRRAPDFAGKVPGLATAVMREAYSHEVSSAGFWPGNADVDAAFYSYAYPTPPGFREAVVRPAGAQFSETLGEFLLPYSVMRKAADPEAVLMEFLQSTYEAAANCAGWDRAALECPQGVPRGPLAVTSG